MSPRQRRGRGVRRELRRARRVVHPRPSPGRRGAGVHLEPARMPPVGGLTPGLTWTTLSPMKAIVVVTSVGTEEQAIVIARALVNRRQAACVNILPGIRSVYRWKGEVCQDEEFLLVVKTRDAEYDAVAATIQELHTYDLPEVLAFEVVRGDSDFLDWIRGSTDKSAVFEDDEYEDDEDDDYDDVDPDDTAGS